MSWSVFSEARQHKSAGGHLQCRQHMLSKSGLRKSARQMDACQRALVPIDLTRELHSENVIHSCETRSPSDTSVLW
ncbi:hypothetical protein PC116_g7850 [Phytophthora cactorum]|uniref:Uncharacterized protein n=1 Tax=Phytophthora cactorum TaxID=29920 RepID=A0A8T1L9T6_9STRA|nr:hypothetical protein PC114_g5613 [Phytophthora cactorum]KAG2953529.1 hypothetical protein PC117_g1976 [Phytophthora cactorum]KAG3034375.1 hypothetical protein PC119_g4921 [Phytophthora cactorum]KAG3034877.1 hypothetical protein PC120_g1209 [Phytophthora cactorum]KAG3183931.1 hypothetical protein C6341_g5276 [Phytophthora cactorum]